MSTRYLCVIPRNTAHLAKRLAQLLSKRKLLRAAHVMAPTLVALTAATPKRIGMTDRHYLYRRNTVPQSYGMEKLQSNLQCCHRGKDAQAS
jgi:hypothetical protein